MIIFTQLKEVFNEIIETDVENPTKHIGDIEYFETHNKQIAKDKEIITHDVTYCRKCVDILKLYIENNISSERW